MLIFFRIILDFFFQKPLYNNLIIYFNNLKNYHISINYI